MYLTMIRESERAIRILAAAQQRCEALYHLGAAEPGSASLKKPGKGRVDTTK